MTAIHSMDARDLYQHVIWELIKKAKSQALSLNEGLNKALILNNVKNLNLDWI